MDFTACRTRAAYFVDLASSSPPERAAHYYSLASKTLQRTFESLSKRSYVHGKVAELARETASMRQAASQRYQGVGNAHEAGIELSRGARCLESYARYLIENVPPEPPAPKENLIQLLKEALRYRSSASGFFRSDAESSLNLAFELSYSSKTMSFLMKHCPEYNIPETLDQMIKDLSESTLIFEQHREYKEAYFGYWHLALSLMDKGRSDPSCYLPAISSIHKAIEMSEKGRLDPARIPKLYGIAASAYRRLASACNDSYTDFYLEQAREIALKVIEAGDKADGETTLS